MNWLIALYLASSLALLAVALACFFKMWHLRDRLRNSESEVQRLTRRHEEACVMLTAVRFRATKDGHQSVIDVLDRKPMRPMGPPYYMG